MKRILLLSSDTLHHRYFINRWLGEGLPMTACLFETEHVEAPFATGPLFEEEETAFEEQNFFREVSRELPSGLAVHEVTSVNSIPAVKLIQDLRPDFGVVFGTGYIHPSIIELFSDGLINVHRGIAQDYRGLDSDLWAIYHRDFEGIGVTIHRVDHKLDTGEVIFQESMELRNYMRISHIRFHTSIIATRLVIQALHDYLSNSMEQNVQSQVGRYYSFMPLELKRICEQRFNRYCKKLP